MHDPRMEPRHVSHVMGVQRAGQDLQEHPRSDVEQGEDVGDREAASGPLAGGLAEMGLEFGSIGHRERGAVDDEDTMAEPASGVEGRGVERIGDAADQLLEDLQRQAGPSQAVGGGGEGLAGEMGEMTDRGISVEDLDQEDVDGSAGVEEGASPSMAAASTERVDGGAVEKWRGVLLETVKDANNPVMHQRTSCMWCRQETPS